MYINSFYLIFNNYNNLDLDFKITTRPSIPPPIRRLREVEIEGRDGLLYEDLGTYEDIEISVECNFVSASPESFNEDYRKIKKWLNNIKDNKLKFSDDLGYFYLVNKVAIDTPEKLIRRACKFNILFTCEPYMYLEEGKIQIPLQNNIYNYYELSKPSYIINGEGLITINANGNIIKANIGQKLIIDTNLGLCYRSDGSLNNVAMTGKYKDLYLKEGENIFSFTSGFDIEIIPNWRCL